MRFTEGLLKLIEGLLRVYWKLIQAYLILLKLIEAHSRLSKHKLGFHERLPNVATDACVDGARMHVKVFMAPDAQCRCRTPAHRCSKLG